MSRSIALGAFAIVLLMGIGIFYNPQVGGNPASGYDTNTLGVRRMAWRHAPTARTCLPQPSTPTILELLETNIDAVKLTVAQADAFIEANNHSIDSLLGAFRASGDEKYLRQAAEKYPNDPRVNFAAAMKTENPEERRQWLDNFQKAAPENALADYLSAQNHFASGDTEKALQDLAAATSKREFNDYSQRFVQDVEEAYRAAGYSEAEAKAAACAGLLLPQLKNFKDISLQLRDLADSYHQAGDEASAQRARNMGLTLGRRLDAGDQYSLIHELVGIAIERIMLRDLDVSARYLDSEFTVKDRLDQLTLRRDEIKALPIEENTLKSLRPDEFVAFYDRLKLFGEADALQWLKTKRAQ